MSNDAAGLRRSGARESKAWTQPSVSVEGRGSEARRDGWWEDRDFKLARMALGNTKDSNKSCVFGRNKQ